MHKHNIQLIIITPNMRVFAFFINSFFFFLLVTYTKLQIIYFLFYPLIINTELYFDLSQIQI